MGQTCYSYHPLTLEFIGETLADPSPLEPGVWLYPGFTTLEPPPGPYEEGFAWIWQSDRWLKVEDHRGETWYTTGDTEQPHVIDLLGDPTKFDPPFVKEPPDRPEIKNVPDKVFDWQFAGQAASEGIISLDAAKLWIKQGDIPTVLTDAIEQLPIDDERKTRIELFLMGTKEFPRNHELTPMLATFFGKDTPEKLDQFFIDASKR